MRQFRQVKAPPGCTIALHGCRYCNFDCVFAIASDATGANRVVGRWGVSPTSGQYVLTEECGPNPPAWLDLIRAALPPRPTRLIELDEQGNPI
jgi:hypothetical protein